MKLKVSYYSFTVLLAALFSTTVTAQIDAGQADSLFQAQQWQQAADAYSELTEQDKENAQYWFRLGQSFYNLQHHKQAIGPLQQALGLQDPNVPRHFVLLLLARCQAALGQSAEAIRNVAAIAETGASLYLPVKSSSEFAELSDNPRFIAALDLLKPCQTENHRAFDLWLGEWEVTSPNRPGWIGNSSITLSNDGCSIHEHYTTPGGYAGRSINFYDTQKQKWHQTWVDNQGSPLYLEGGFENGAMVLSNTNSRITWSVQSDGRVRQLWESTSDGGETWTTAFDGYYKKKDS